MEPEVIIDEWSPLGNIQALVEKTERTYYFYLWINPESKQPQIRSCWICNRRFVIEKTHYSNCMSRKEDIIWT